MQTCLISSGWLAAKPVVQKKKVHALPFAIGNVSPLVVSIKMKLQLFKLILPLPLWSYLDLHTASHPFLPPCAASVPFAPPARCQPCYGSM